MTKDLKLINQFALSIRQDVLSLAYKCNGPAHIGGSLSIAEILAVLYGKVLRLDPKNPNWTDRDRFILSKGHAVLALYAALCKVGFFDRETLFTFKVNGSDLIAHPVMNSHLGIESSNGSLGHGLSFSTGIAAALKKKSMVGNVYVLLGDGECEEGSVWEAAMLARKLDLENLTCIIDSNGMQSDGPVSSINSHEWLEKRWQSFGWETENVDGHNASDLVDALSKPRSTNPRAIIARTVKGKGVSFMEHNNVWHHNRITEDFFRIAMNELENDSAGY